jgi:hypothetical protein
LLIAREQDGYQWQTAATLRVAGVEADQWVGNVCLTESATRAVVVYGPRGFTNLQQASERDGMVIP